MEKQTGTLTTEGELSLKSGSWVSGALVLRAIVGFYYLLQMGTVEASPSAGRGQRQFNREQTSILKETSKEMRKCESVSGIYLLELPMDRKLAAAGMGDWENAPLLDEPIISACDIHSYDWEEHRIRFNPSVMRRIPSPPVEGLGFVVVINGERIYPGFFTTLFSSFSVALPNICVERWNKSDNSVTMDQGYPTAAFGTGPDHRNDERVRKAFADAGKLNRLPLTKVTQVAGAAAQTSYKSLVITTNDVIRFVQPDAGVALVRFENLDGERVNYQCRFKSVNREQEKEFRGSLYKIGDRSWQSQVMVNAGDISFEWSEGGGEKAYIYFDPTRQKATLLAPIAFKAALP